MRLGLAQLNPIVGDLAGNRRRILDAYAALVAQGAELVVFPELAVCGYPPRDLLFKRRFVPDVAESLAQIAAAIGAKPPAKREARLFMVLAPIEFLVLTSLTPAEYVWYATHRPGKKFRQVTFTELRWDPSLHLAASSMYEQNRAEILQNSSKKTKTLVIGDVFNRVRFPSWVGYDREAEGGLYAGDDRGARLWRFPATHPRAWERAY